MSRMPLLGANEPSNTATPGAASNAVPSSSAADAEVPTVSAPAAGPSAPPTVPQRTLTWTGILVWVKKMGNQMQVIKHLRCQMSVSSNDMEPELKVDTWPKKMVMVLVPKQITMYGGGSYLKGSKSVVFHLQPNEAVQALTKVMLKGFVGYVHFGPKWASPQCDIKMLLLLYSIDKKVHYGFIPNKQTTFIERLKTVIRQQNISRFIGKQITGPVLPLRTLAPPGAGQVMRSGGTMGLGTTMGSNQTMALYGSRGATAGMGPSGVMGPSGSMGRGVAMGGVGVGALAGMAAQAQDIVTFIQSLQNRLSIMTARDMGGQVGPACSATGQQVGQLDRLEAARRQNQENVPYLRELLEQHQLQQQLYGAGAHAARGDLMRPIMPSNPELRRLLQQEQHLLQQQLHGAGAHAARGDLMRPIMPSNPGLRRLLQQQPQYRVCATRPPQPQQFGEVTGCNNFL